nr:phage holin, LLH family [Lentilactobacillus hilgardii]
MVDLQKEEITVFSQVLKWIHWADANGLFTFLAMLLLAIYRLIRPLIKEKIKTEQNHEKLQALALADQLAATIIPELVVLSELTGDQRKKEAIKFVNRKLKVLGLSLTDETIAAKVEKAYSVYKNEQKGKQTSRVKESSMINKRH